MDADFTAKMESQLDDVEDGKIDWVSTLDNFYGDFSKALENAEKNMDGTRIKIPDEETDVVCEKCGRNMVVKTGRFGKFLACPGYPECKNTKKIVKETGGVCPLCGGRVLEKKSKSGKVFFGCEKYPECTFTTWDAPVTDQCPDCGSTLFRKKGRGGKIHCLKPGCGYEEGLAAPEKEEAAAVETDDMPPVEKKTPAKKTASKKAPAKKAPAKKPAAKKTAGKSAGGESRES